MRDSAANLLGARPTARVLHIGKYFPPVTGGIERFLADLVGAQRAAGNDVSVLVHANESTDTGADPAWVMRCPVWFRLIFAPISPAFPFWLSRAIERFAPDVLHLHMPNLSCFWALLLPAARALPWVVHWHADVEPSRFRLALRLSYPHYRIFERAILEHAQAIVATSPQYLEASSALRPWRLKCHVIPLGLDPGRLAEIGPKETVGLWHGNGLRLLSIGRLTYYKGFDTLIRAVAGATDMELVIVGEGEERSSLEKVLAEHGNPHWIRLLGQADDATCQRLLASCDVFCLPSRERTEAFGMVLLEAMRYGKPLIASQLEGSGVTWVVQDGRNGVLVPPDNPPAWRESLATLAREPQHRQELGESGRTRFEREFDIATTASRLSDLYASVPAEDRAATVRKHHPLIVIPARDEAATIGSVIAAVHAGGYPDVVVVDDGSRDDTAAIATAAGATMLRAPLRQGAWGAMQTGIRYAVRNGYPGVVTMDADGQHEPAYLEQLLKAGETADVVIGACPARGSRLRRLAWAYFRFLTGFNFEDLTSGFRYYNSSACCQLAAKEATLLDYQDIGVLLLLRKARFRIREVAVVMNPRQVGASRVFDSWPTVMRYMAETTLLCMARWKIRPPRP